MRPTLTNRFRAGGFSLVEILVGVIIGLLGILVIFQSFQTFEGYKRTTTSGVDAQETGLMAMHNVAREIELAGYGMPQNGTLMCSVLNIYQQGSAYSIPFMPVRIIDGGAGPDRIEVMYSSSPFAPAPGRLGTPVTDSSQSLAVTNAYYDATKVDPNVAANRNQAPYVVGDDIVIGLPGSEGPCARLTVGAVNAAGLGSVIDTVAHGGNNLFSGTFTYPSGFVSPHQYNAPGSGFPAGTSPAVVVNMGTFIHRRYEVRSGDLWVQDLRQDLANLGTTAAVSIGKEVVNIQAQYGISAAVGSQQVTSWVNATGNWSNPNANDNLGTAFDIRRIKAVRIAIVARSSLPEKEDVYPAAEYGDDTPCLDKDQPNARGICAWVGSAGNPSPDVDMSSVANWRKHRYRVYETIIPLRNIVWADL
ncbi:MAG: PilW family protein [Pseudomonadota bacterium]